MKCLVALLRLSPNFTCTRDRYACSVGRADDAGELVLTKSCVNRNSRHLAVHLPGTCKPPAPHSTTVHF